MDEKIFLKQSERVSFHWNFSDQFVTNHLIKAGEWKAFFNQDDVDSMDTVELLAVIGNYSGLQCEVVDNLCLSFSSHTCTGKTVKVIQYQDDHVLDDRVYVDNSGTEHPLYFDQLQLVVQMPKGTDTQVDVTCNSEFMLQCVREIGRSIRAKYHNVPLSTPIYLVLDNAGGHGTKDCKRKFMRILCRKYNVLCIWQVSCGPDTNMLDLGAWTAVQAEVEERY